MPVSDWSVNSSCKHVQDVTTLEELEKRHLKQDTVRANAKDAVEVYDPILFVVL